MFYAFMCTFAVWYMLVEMLCVHVHCMLEPRVTPKVTGVANRSRR